MSKTAAETRQSGANANTGTPALEAWTAKIIMVIAVSLSLYQLYTAGITALTALIQRSIHLGAILTWCAT